MPFLLSPSAAALRGQRRSSAPVAGVIVALLRVYSRQLQCWAFRWREREREFRWRRCLLARGGFRVARSMRGYYPWRVGKGGGCCTAHSLSKKTTTSISRLHDLQCASCLGPRSRLRLLFRLAAALQDHAADCDDVRILSRVWRPIGLDQLLQVVQRPFSFPFSRPPVFTAAAFTRMRSLVDRPPPPPSHFVSFD